MAKTKKKQTREERLEKKRIAERLRYQRLKNDPIKLAHLKEKERRNYLNKKEKGKVKSIKDMTTREQRAIRKVWAEKTRKRRARLALRNPSVASFTPPCSDEEAHPLQPIKNRVESARKRSEKNRRRRNRLIMDQQKKIEKLKKEVRCYKKKIYRLYKIKENLTPNTKVRKMVANKNVDVEQVKKKLLFGEVLQEQLKENLKNAKSDTEKRMFRRVVSGQITKKYKILDTLNIKITRPGKTSLFDMSRKTRFDKIYEKTKQEVMKFLEDCNSRLCPGKRDCITRKKERKKAEKTIIR